MLIKNKHGGVRNESLNVEENAGAKSMKSGDKKTFTIYFICQRQTKFKEKRYVLEWYFKLCKESFFSMIMMIIFYKLTIRHWNKKKIYI